MKIGQRNMPDSGGEKAEGGAKIPLGRVDSFVFDGKMLQ